MDIETAQERADEIASEDNVEPVKVQAVADAPIAWLVLNQEIKIRPDFLDSLNASELEFLLAYSLQATSASVQKRLGTRIENPSRKPTVYAVGSKWKISSYDIAFLNVISITAGLLASLVLHSVWPIILAFCEVALLSMISHSVARADDAVSTAYKRSGKESALSCIAKSEQYCKHPVGKRLYARIRECILAAEANATP